MPQQVTVTPATPLVSTQTGCVTQFGMNLFLSMQAQIAALQTAVATLKAAKS